MERLGERRRDDRRDADPARRRRDPRREHDRVQVAAGRVGAVVRPVGVARLQREGVLDRHEVDHGLLRLDDLVDPPAGGEQLARPRAGLAPRRRMPAAAGEPYVSGRFFVMLVFNDRDLSPRPGSAPLRRPPRPCPERLADARPARRRPRVPSLLDRRASCLRRDLGRRARGRHRPHRLAHAPAAHRLRRRPAAQPPAAAGRRAVLHARGPVPRPHRSRDRPLGGHRRRGDRRGARAPAGHGARPRLRPPARRAALVRRRPAAARRRSARRRARGADRHRAPAHHAAGLDDQLRRDGGAARLRLRVRLAHEPGRRGAGAPRLPRELRRLRARATSPTRCSR